MKKRSILCHQNRALPGQILPLEWLKNIFVLVLLKVLNRNIILPDTFFRVQINFFKGGCISHMSGCKCATNCKYEYNYIFTEKELTRSTTRLRSVALSLNQAQQSRCSGFSPDLVAIITLIIIIIDILVIIIITKGWHNLRQLC